MRVLAINDISCVGKCSLTVTLPILSSCGVECDVLPTAMLSTHTGGFSDYFFRDCTQDIPQILQHWKSLGLTFDFIYSGYLGDIEQIDLVLFAAENFLSENGKLIVDPVMGDSGKLYKGFSNAFVEKMRDLCRKADYILPNVTEACYLADFPYPLDDSSAKNAVIALRALCPHPVVTGVTTKNRVSVYYAKNDNVCTYAHENVEGFFHGAGDVFASAFIGGLANGKTEDCSIRLAADFVTACIRRSEKEVPDKRFGLAFEKEIFPFLQKLFG